MLEDIKLYLKVSHDVEDNYITELIEWAKAFIKEKTSQEYDENDYIMRDLVRLLVAYRYYNRNAVGEKNMIEYPYCITEMLKTLAFRG
jgi:uncharacterized phage protein (predicted DNA packaging)